MTSSRGAVVGRLLLQDCSGVGYYKCSKVGHLGMDCGQVWGSGGVDGVCYYCGLMRYMAVCSLCGETGHLGKDCWAGELSNAEIDNLMTIMANPRQFKIPDWFLKRKKGYKDSKYSQVTSNALDIKLRDDLERLKKISG